ncbi:MAG: flavodoxin family protein [Candidatus Sumerlaeaceae bacterium]
MARILIFYYSRTGNTEKMAQLIAEGMQLVPGVKVELARVPGLQASLWLDYDALVAGVPVYYGMIPAAMKQLFDESVEFHGQLKGKLGGAFASSANVGGGNETAILDIIHGWLIHGMLVMGDYSNDHYGPVSIGEPDKRAHEVCLRWGQTFAETAVRLFGPPTE